MGCMVFSERPYTLSERGHEIAQESGVLEAIDGSASGGSQSISEHYLRHSYYPSSDTLEDRRLEAMRYMYFEVLEHAQTTEQKEKIKKIFQDFLNDDRLQLRWKIESDSEKTDTLFGSIPKVIRDIPIKPLYDAALLSGLEAAELLEEVPELAEELAEKYFADYLGAAAFVGAVMLSNRRPEYFMTDRTGEIVREITCGGDFHGDFRIHVNTCCASDSRTPHGELVPFVPQLDSQTLAAYHSVEPDIVLSALHYFEHTTPNGSEQGEILKDILETTKDANPGAGNFGDFGDDDLDEQMYKIKDEERWKLDALSPLHGFSPFEYLVIPGNENFIFRTRVDVDEFVIENYYRDGSSQPIQLRLDSQQTSRFLAVLINSGGGRTYHGTLRSMIQARLEVLGETS